VWLYKILPSEDYLIYVGPLIAKEAEILIKGPADPVKVKIFQEQLAISFDDWVALYFKNEKALNEFLDDFTKALKAIEKAERVKYESL